MDNVKLHLYDLASKNILLNKYSLSIGSDVVLGSASTADIMINQSNQVIAGEHVRITYVQKNKLYLLNISDSHQTLLNGVLLKCGEGRVVKAGDKFHLSSLKNNFEKGVLIVVYDSRQDANLITQTDILNKLETQKKSTYWERSRL